MTPSHLLTGIKRKVAKRYLDRENRKWPETLTPAPMDQWPQPQENERIPKAVFRSRDYLVQVFDEMNGLVRISANRTRIAADGNWSDGLTWDELQQIKSEVGYADKDAVEVYPHQMDIVNIYNMRHLWVFPQPLFFAWRAAITQPEEPAR